MRKGSNATTPGNPPRVCDSSPPNRALCGRSADDRTDGPLPCSRSRPGGGAARRARARARDPADEGTERGSTLGGVLPPRFRGEPVAPDLRGRARRRAPRHAAIPRERAGALGSPLGRAQRPAAPDPGRRRAAPARARQPTHARGRGAGRAPAHDRGRGARGARVHGALSRAVPRRGLGPAARPCAQHVPRAGRPAVVHRAAAVSRRRAGGRRERVLPHQPRQPDPVRDRPHLRDRHPARPGDRFVRGPPSRDRGAGDGSRPTSKP